MPAVKKPKGRVKLTVHENKDPQTGQLVCDTHPGVDWCGDIKSFIQDGLDARDKAGVPISLGDKVVTPIIPTNGWNLEIFLDTPEAHGVRKAFILHSLDVVILGYLCPGEGRAVLREMFLDWLQGVMSRSQAIKCTSPTHRPQNAANRTLAQQMQEGWMLLENGLCADCSQYLDFESDVPEDI